MTVGFVGVTTDYSGSGGAASCTFQNSDNTMPTVTAGQMLIVVIGWGNLDGIQPTAPAGWINFATFSGGAGSFTAEDSGTRTISAWYRIADGTENGQAYTFSNPSTNTTGRTIWGYCFRFSKTLTYWNVPVVTGGTDDTSGATYSATCSSDIGATTGDMYLSAVATNPSATTYTLLTTWPGVNAGSNTMTDAKTGQTTSGYNVRVNARYRAVTSGTSTGAPVLSSSADVIGPGIVIRLRDTNTSPNTAPVANAGPDLVNQDPWTDIPLDGSGSTDAENNITTYAWTKTSTNTGTATIADPTARVTSVKISPTQVVDETFTFQLQVTDSGGLSSTDTVNIGVLRASEFCYRNGVLKPVRITSA